MTRFVYTNVDRDGMLEGPDLDEVRRVSEAVRGRFLYSGGIGSLDDLRALRELRLVNLAGVISGKALYEGRFGVARGRRCSRADAAPARDPLPRRGQGPRGQGRRVREPARRRRPRRAGGALPGRGSGRDRLPRHHRVAREARDRGGAGPPLRRRRVHPVHDRRRGARGGGRPGRARRGRRQGLGELRGGRAARSCCRSWPRCSAPSAWCWRSTPRARGGRLLRRLRERRADAGRPRRDRVGARGRGARGGGDPADEHGPRRHRGRLRARADPRRSRTRWTCP